MRARASLARLRRRQSPTPRPGPACRRRPPPRSACSRVQAGAWHAWRVVGVLSTAFTCGPAPIANSISVAVGESETIAVGLARDGDRCRSPRARLPGSARRRRRVGRAGSGWSTEVAPAGRWPRSGGRQHRQCGDQRREATSRVGDMVILHRCRGGRSAPAATPGGGSHEPPFLRGLVAPMQTGVRARPRGRGHTVAGQRRVLTGLRCFCAIPGNVPGTPSP